MSDAGDKDDIRIDAVAGDVSVTTKANVELSKSGDRSGATALGMLRQREHGLRNRRQGAVRRGRILGRQEFA